MTPRSPDPEPGDDSARTSEAVAAAETATGEDAAPERPGSSPGDDSAAPPEGSQTYLLSEIADPATVRRAPRFSRFLVLGAFLGLIAAALVTLLSRDSALSDGNLFGLLLIAFVPVGILLGGGAAVLLDRRSIRRRDRRLSQSS